MDLVYIVREGDDNVDLRYSLRSIEKFVPYNKIWIVGYKPKWVQNVEYLPIKQDCGSKWKNSIKNIEAACKCKDISEDFILMNDDFFAIKPIENLEESVNINLGNLDIGIKKFGTIKSNWGRGFNYLKDLLEDLNISKPYYNFESHTPMIINKKKYLEVMSLPKVQEFMKTSKVLHKRSLYGNYAGIGQKGKVLLQDVKIQKVAELNTKTKVCDWVSTFDGQITSIHKYASLSHYFNRLFPNKSKFENDDFVLPILIKNEQPKVVVNQVRSSHLKKKPLYYF